MRRTLSFIMALIIILSHTSSAFASSNTLAMINEPTKRFFATTVAGMEETKGYTLDGGDNDWFADETRRAELAILLFLEIMGQEPTWTKDFTLEDVLSGGYISKTDQARHPEIALCVWTEEKALCATYTPYTGVATYKLYPFDREIIEQSFIDEYWEFEKDAFDEAVEIILAEAEEALAARKANLS